MIYDTHCHVFNLGFLLKEAEQMLADSVAGVYPYTTPAPDMMGAEVKDNRISVLIGYLTELLGGLNNSEKTNNAYIQQTLRAYFPLPSRCVTTVPLMMDIYYMFAYSLGEGQTARNPSAILRDTPGFTSHMRALWAISDQESTLPFFAVDPRRPGAVQAVLDGVAVTNHGPFYGIKLYPRLGYHPTADRMPELYTYCTKNNIPITTHCSTSGFPPSTDAASAALCDPLNFTKALEANPALKINFAHWGYGSSAWGDSITALMHTYPNVYADLSCFNGNNDLSNFKQARWSDPVVQSRTLYGSDYDIFYLAAPAFSFDMKTYLASFGSNFTWDELANMAGILPARFLT